MTTIRIVTLLILLCSLLALIAGAADYYVDAEHGDDANSGLAPGDAWQTITHAMAALETSPSCRATVHVAEGEYGEYIEH